MSKTPNPNRRLAKGIGYRLRAVRESQNLTAQEAAEKIGVKENTYRGWESGTNIPLVGVLYNAAQSLGVEMSDVLPGDREDRSKEVMKRLRYEFGLIMMDGEGTLREMIVIQKLADAIKRVEDMYDAGEI